MPHWKRSLILIGLCFLHAGCSYQYVDEHGTRHVWGLVHTTHRDIPDARSDVIVQQVSTLGIAILRLPQERGLSIGLLLLE